MVEARKDATGDSKAKTETKQEYIDRKIKEAREKAQLDPKVSRRHLSRVAAQERKKREIEQEIERRNKLTPEQKREEDLRLKVEKSGAHILSGNLLNWTNGRTKPALESRYRKAISLKVQKLALSEAIECLEVVKQLIIAIPLSTSRSSVQLRKASDRKVERLKVTRLELKQFIALLRTQEKEEKRNAKRRPEALSLPVQDNIDNALAEALSEAMNAARRSSQGYVYLKQWSLPDGTRWFKLGITSNPKRRDAEQNVLPVPARTIRCIETRSMEQAAAIERALMSQLVDLKVRGARNKELFNLSDPQLAALLFALDS